MSNRDLWHWCLVWKWEQQSYDIPLPSKLSSEQKKELKTIEQRLTDFLEVKKAPQGPINAAYKTFEKAAISPSIAGTGFIGTPIVAPDEQDKKKGEMSWNDIETNRILLRFLIINPQGNAELLLISRIQR